MTTQTLERCFNERIDKVMGNIVDTVEDGISNAILTQVLILKLQGLIQQLGKKMRPLDET